LGWKQPFEQIFVNDLLHYNMFLSKSVYFSVLLSRAGGILSFLETSLTKLSNLSSFRPKSLDKILVIVYNLNIKQFLLWQ